MFKKMYSVVNYKEEDYNKIVKILFDRNEMDSNKNYIDFQYKPKKVQLESLKKAGINCEIKAVNLINGNVETLYKETNVEVINTEKQTGYTWFKNDIMHEIETDISLKEMMPVFDERKQTKNIYIFRSLNDLNNWKPLTETQIKNEIVNNKLISSIAEFDNFIEVIIKKDKDIYGI